MGKKPEHLFYIACNKKKTRHGKGGGDYALMILENTEFR